MVLCIGPSHAVFKNIFYLYLYSMATLLVFKFIQSLAMPLAFGRGRFVDMASHHHLILEVELRFYFSGTLLPKVSFAIQQQKHKRISIQPEGGGGRGEGSESADLFKYMHICVCMCKQI